MSLYLCYGVSNDPLKKEAFVDKEQRKKKNANFKKRSWKEAPHHSPNAMVEISIHAIQERGEVKYFLWTN